MRHHRGWCVWGGLIARGVTRDGPHLSLGSIIGRGSVNDVWRKCSLEARERAVLGRCRQGIRTGNVRRQAWLVYFTIYTEHYGRHAIDPFILHLYVFPRISLFSLCIFLLFCFSVGVAAHVSTDRRCPCLSIHVCPWSVLVIAFRYSRTDLNPVSASIEILLKKYISCLSPECLPLLLVNIFLAVKGKRTSTTESWKRYSESPLKACHQRANYKQIFSLSARKGGGRGGKHRWALWPAWAWEYQYATKKVFTCSLLRQGNRLYTAKEFLLNLHTY